MSSLSQGLLFPAPQVNDQFSTTFVNNMGLPVHRWFRYSAGFSAEWVTSVIAAASRSGEVRCFDPFAGSATTLIACERLGAESYGIDSHPFVARIARAKLQYRSDPEEYRRKIDQIRDRSRELHATLTGYPTLIRQCFPDEQLAQLDLFRQAYEIGKDASPASELAWLTLISILRAVATAGTAQWQYILPKKGKKAPANAADAFEKTARIFYEDMAEFRYLSGPRARFVATDARTCEGIPEAFANLVVTSPPYPNNYDYADATRLEMSFMREIRGWGCLQDTVRKHLIRSCSQHVPERTVNLKRVLNAPELEPIRTELTSVCDELANIRLRKGGKKTYHLMIACYFKDLAQVWRSLRRICTSPSRVCFVVGDSAPYGVYVPVIPWMGKLAQAAGFGSYSFEKTRDRNIKWKNRKHRVPLQEGRLWVEG